MDCITVPVRGLNANAVTKVLKRTKGVHGVDIDLMNNQAVITYDETIASPQRLEQIVQLTYHDTE